MSSFPSNITRGRGRARARACACRLCGGGGRRVPAGGAAAAGRQLLLQLSSVQALHRGAHALGELRLLGRRAHVTETRSRRLVKRERNRPTRPMPASQCALHSATLAAQRWAASSSLCHRVVARTLRVPRVFAEALGGKSPPIPVQSTLGDFRHRATCWPRPRVFRSRPKAHSGARIRARHTRVLCGWAG